MLLQFTHIQREPNFLQNLRITHFTHIHRQLHDSIINPQSHVKGTHGILLIHSYSEKASQSQNLCIFHLIIFTDNSIDCMFPIIMPKVPIVFQNSNAIFRYIHLGLTRRVPVEIRHQCPIVKLPFKWCYIQTALDVYSSVLHNGVWNNCFEMLWCYRTKYAESINAMMCVIKV